MQPILRSKDGTKIGVLSDILSCTVTEQRNGAYTANFTYPYVGIYFEQIEHDCIVEIKPNQKSDIQKFRVSSISKAINGIVSYGCEHISYDLNKNPIMVVSLNEGTAKEILVRLLSSTVIDNYYIGESDIPTVKKCELDFMSAREAILKTQQYFGGELEWDNSRIILHSERGEDNNAVIAYGDNLISYNQNFDISSIYTALAPYMQITDDNGDKITYNLPEKVLKYDNADNYAYIRAQAMDFTSEFTEEEFEKLTTENDIIYALRFKALEYMDKNPPTDTPKSVTLSYVDLLKAGNPTAINIFSNLGLCDYVTLQDPRLGINYKAKVITTKFNVITEMYDSIEIGNPRQNLLEALASIVNINNDNSKKDKTIGETVDTIEQNIDEYFSEIKVTDNKIVFKSGSIKDRAGTYNTYTYKITRDSDTQESGKGKIISIVDPKNRKTKILRE